MRVLRDSLSDPTADHEVTSEMVARTRESGEPAVRVWAPPRQVAFGPRDVRADGYERARSAVARRGYPAVERESGGRAVAFTGETVAFALAEAVDERGDADSRFGVQDRYDVTTERIRTALANLGVDARMEEPSDSFCPGAHSLSAHGKLVGIAQRVRKDVAMVGGVVVTRDSEAVAAVLDPVYDALGLPFEPGSVGSVERAGGNGDPDAVVAAVRDGLVAGRPTSVVSVRDT